MVTMLTLKVKLVKRVVILLIGEITAPLAECVRAFFEQRRSRQSDVGWDQ
jgi:hypothetical protein